MMRIEGSPILTAGAMRAAETASGVDVHTLMARAGAGVAEQVRRLAMGAQVLILCGPGNNGGDGYVAATHLAAAGIRVRVAAVDPPRSEAAVQARSGWNGPIERLCDAPPAPVLVDAVFGTGMARPLSGDIDEALGRLLRDAALRFAVDVPSGVDADRGEVPTYLGDDACFDVTLALGACKPAHVLPLSTRVCGAVRLVDIGLDHFDGVDQVIRRPMLPPPGPDDHKYTRGMVAILAGPMEGAARLCATAALRAGAGYVAIYGGSGSGGADAIVHRAYDAGALADPRIGAIVVGPGLGRDDAARERLDAAIESDAPLVIDGDALRLLDLDRLSGRAKPVVLTPHAGEFTALFGALAGSAIDRSRAASQRIGGHVVVLKGATTVIARAGRTIVSPGGSGWLSTAGTGDVLAGAIAAMLARGGSAADGVWLHAEAARRAGPAFIADDLAYALSAARGSL